MVAACLAGESAASEVDGVPVVGDFDAAADVVGNVNAGTVAVLSCPEMDGVKPARLPGSWRRREPIFASPATSVLIPCNAPAAAG